MTSFKKYFPGLVRYIMFTTTAMVLMAFAYYFFPEKKLAPNARIDSMVVYKKKHQLRVYEKGKLLKTYSVSLGKNPVGKKQREGDFKTPEGVYFIDQRTVHSDFHKMLGVSYPNKADLKNARRKGWSPGGAIKIHGIRNGYGWTGKFQRWLDWTAGCIALTDQDLDEIYKSVKVGCPVTIHP